MPSQFTHTVLKEMSVHAMKFRIHLPLNMICFPLMIFDFLLHHLVNIVPSPISEKLVTFPTVLPLCFVLLAKR